MHVRECRAAKPQKVRNEGSSPRGERETACTARANEISVVCTMQKYNYWLMCEALTTNCQQSKLLTRWLWLKHCRNVCHVSPKIDTLKAEKSEGFIRSSYLRSWCYCNFANWFWKKPDFSIVVWDKARYKPKYEHFRGCLLHKISVKWGWQA